MSPSWLMSTILTMVTLLLVQHVTSDSQPSETLSELQFISNFISDNKGQSNNETSNEDDQRLVRDDLEDSEESTDIADPDWMGEWRRKMEVYSGWLDRFSNPFPMNRPSTFARKSRGRIDRMPLSYGKRSVRSDLIKDENDNSGFDGPEKQPRIASKSGEGREINSLEDSSEGNNPYTRIRKGRLSRMPITYGKRVPNAGIQGVYFTRFPKGRIDRMPLTFGKRGESVLRDGHFERIPKGRIDRMPLTFGKREGKDSVDNADAEIHAISLTPESMSLADASQEKDILGKEIDGDGQIVRIARARLGRMPAMFGKRQDGEMLENTQDSDVFFTRIAKGRINRMPAMFGKRDDEETEETENNSVGENVFSRSTKSRIGRMPAMFGKREPEGILDDAEETENDIFSRDTKSRIGRMPAMFGKREDQTLEDNLEDNDVFSRNAKSRIGRMPAMFGKREDQNQQHSSKSNDVFSRTEKSRIGRMPAMFGKRGDEKMLDISDDSDNVFSRTAKGSIDRMPAMFGKREDADFFFRIQKGRLNRMPLTFGKRQGDETTGSLLGDNEDYVFERVAKDSLARMPMAFGKRRSSPEYQHFIDAIRSKLNTLPPKRRDELHEKLHNFLDNLKMVHKPLTRLQRSRIDRMPLTYGKRSRSTEPLTDIPSESNDIINNLSNLDLDRGSSDFKWNTQKRLRVDRMPVAFGKRSMLGDRLFEDVILGSEKNMLKDNINSKSAFSQSDNLDHSNQRSHNVVDSESISSTHVR